MVHSNCSLKSMLKAICEDYLLGKGGYAYINKKNNKILGLNYVEDSKINIQKNTDAIFKNYTILVDEKPYRPFNFIKLLRNTKDGSSGTGYIDEINKSLQTAHKRILYELDLMNTNGNKKGFLKSKTKLDFKDENHGLHTKLGIIITMEIQVV